MKIKDDYLIFSTGKKVYAHAGFVGIKYDNGWRISEGYDGGVYFDEEMTPAECVELADYMINQWVKFKEDKLK